MRRAENINQQQAPRSTQDLRRERDAWLAAAQAMIPSSESATLATGLDEVIEELRLIRRRVFALERLIAGKPE